MYKPGRKFEIAASCLMALWLGAASQPSLAQSEDTSLDALRTRSGDLMESGFRDSAFRAIDRAVEMAAGLPDPNEAANTLRQLAMQEAVAGASSRAVRTLELALARDTEPQLQDLLRLELGTLRAEAGDLTGARDVFEEACNNASSKVCKSLLLNRLKTLARLGDEAAFRRSLALLLESELDSADYLDAAESSLRLLASGFAEQEATAGELLALAGQGEGADDVDAGIAGYQGRLNELKGDTSRALKSTRRALLLSNERGDSLGVYRWQWQIARLHQQRGDSDAALTSYQTALASMLKVRSAIIAGGRLEFEESVSALFNDALAFLIQVADASSSPDSGLLESTVDFVEEFTTAQVLEYFDDDCMLPSQQLAPEELGENVALLYAIPLESELGLILRSANDIELVRVNASRSDLDALVQDFRAQLESIDDDWIETSEQLHALVFAPLETSLDKHEVETLVVVPMGPLRTIPFTALSNGETFVLERYTVATSLGLRLTSPAQGVNDVDAALLAGISQSVQGFDGLPGVDRELASINQQVGGDVMLNEAFSLNMASEAMASGGHSVVHLATHGYFDPDPVHSFLLTYDDRMTLDRLQETIGQRRFSGERLELLVLSACETAAGDDRAALGLAGVSLKAGADATLATLWPISDEASSQIMIAFYEYLADGEPKGRALRLAQLKVLEDERYDHPYFWSPFLMIGNWQ